RQYHDRSGDYRARNARDVQCVHRRQSTENRCQARRGSGRRQDRRDDVALLRHPQDRSLRQSPRGGGPMFEGFARKRIKTPGAEIALVQGGSGAPLLLLHGYPQTHAIWHKVAPALAQRYTLVIPDLRGYGASSKPPTDDRHLPYAKRAMALDMVEVMRALGFPRFALAGHDRGARVTYRLALDHPDCVQRAAVLDIV